MCIENETLLGYCDDETLERAALTALAAERRLLRPEDRVALDALASAWQRRLPRVFRLNVLKKHGALAAFHELRQEALALNPPPPPKKPYNHGRTVAAINALVRKVELQMQAEPAADPEPPSRTSESHPAFFQMLEYTLKHRRPEQTLRVPLASVVGVARPVSTKTLVGVPIPSASDHEVFPLSRRRPDSVTNLRPGPSGK